MKLGPKLPDRDEKSIEELEERLLKDPRSPVVCITVLDGAKVTLNTLTNAREVMARIRLLTPMHPDDHEHVESMVRRAMQARENQLELPLDVEDEITMILGELFDGDRAHGATQASASAEGASLAHDPLGEFAAPDGWDDE